MTHTLNLDLLSLELDFHLLQLNSISKTELHMTIHVDSLFSSFMQTTHPHDKFLLRNNAKIFNKKSCVAFCAYKNQIQNKNIPWQVTKKNQNETSFPATFSFN